MQEPGLSFDTELLHRITQGDEVAFRILFDAYNKRLFTFVTEMLKSAADAEEVVQDIFTKLWIDRARFSNIDNPGQYLYRMARNKTIDQMRKTARDENLVKQVWAALSQTDSSLELYLQKKETEELISQALLQLTEQKRRVYQLSREQGLSQEQIAELTGLSKSRVNNILTEVLKHIKNHLDSHSQLLAILFWMETGYLLF